MVDVTQRGKILEDEWFRRNEQEMIRKARVRREARLAEEKSAEREKKRLLHHMKCPKCGDDLLEVEHEGIKVDRCSHCEGVFFDAGELDALLTKQSKERRGFFRKLAGILED